MQAAVSFLPNTIWAFLLHYWQPHIEGYLMCRTPSSEIPIWPFYLMSVGLCASNNKNISHLQMIYNNIINNVFALIHFIVQESSIQHVEIF